MLGRKRKEELQIMLESAQKDREMFAQQAEKDRQAILEQISIIRAKTEDVSNMPAIEKGNELKAAYALNLCTVSISQIIDYNDLAIMEQEYENILNNLNLENFPKDESLLKILKQILDVISFFRIQDGEKKLLEEQYKKKVKNAIWSAVPSPSVILAGGKAGWTGIAVSAIAAVGTGYMNYRKERANIDDEKREKDWELQKAALEQFHALRRELFDTAWRLADKYDFKDSYRLTARQISQYNRILLEEDAEKRYERLRYIESKFEAYPPFWYNLGNAAADVFHDAKYSEETRMEFKENALSAFNKFLDLTDEDKKNSLLREDQLRSTCALEKFALISSDENIPIYEKVELLKIAVDNSGNAFDTVQLCASAYLELGVNANAIDLLRMLVNEGYNAEMNAQLLSMLYISILKTEKKSYKNDHEILCKRGYEDYMFPWPQDNLDDNATHENYFKSFFEAQNKFLFDEYKKIVSEYINQCSTAFNDISEQSGDITENIVDFLNGIKKDMDTLFGNKDVAQNVCDKIANSLLEYQGVFCDEGKRRGAKDFSFEKIGGSAFDYVANRIMKQVNIIRTVNEDNEKLKTIACYMNNFLLFKAQTKLLGGSQISHLSIESHKTGFDKLIESSKKNQADYKFVSVIKKYADENKIVKQPDKKCDVTFITENILDAKEVRHKGFIKNIGIKKVIAYLDTDKMDILFTTEGIYAYSFIFGKEYAKYNSGEIKRVGNTMKIGKKTFEHEQVNMETLDKMIDELKKLAPRNYETNIKFEKLVGEFPALKDKSNNDTSSNVHNTDPDHTSRSDYLLPPTYPFRYK